MARPCTAVVTRWEARRVLVLAAVRPLVPADLLPINPDIKDDFQFPVFGFRFGGAALCGRQLWQAGNRRQGRLRHYPALPKSKP